MELQCQVKSGSESPQSRASAARNADTTERGMREQRLAECRRWLTSTPALALLSSMLLWPAFPPLSFWPLAWLAPLGWLLLVRQERWDGPGVQDDSRATRLPTAIAFVAAYLVWFAVLDFANLGGYFGGPAVSAALAGFVLLVRLRRPYWTLYGAGFLFWLPLLHWLRLPHWAGYFSWPAASAVMACYLPLFVALSRQMVHRWKVSLVIAGPVVWTGLELFRAHFLGGFTVASLGHALVGQLPLIQISDLAGGYAVSFLVMLVAACVARMIPWDGQRPAWWPIPLAAAAVGAVLAYGYHRLDQAKQAELAAEAEGRSGLKFALIQGDFDTTFVPDRDRPSRILKQMYRDSHQALVKDPDLDLIIWPETTLGPLHSTDDDPSIQPKQVREDLAKYLNLAGSRPLKLLLGAIIWHNQQREHNAALLIDPEGNVRGRYDKMNAVMFGEYVPLGDYFPWLYKLTPLHVGMSEGREYQAFDVNGLTLCPNICYESMLPHHVRGGIVRMREQGREADVLVNLTNSGWFWGSSELDLHLNCGIFRAVECRMPMLVAANCGVSAVISPTGEVRQRGAPRQQVNLLGRVDKSNLDSPYLTLGDWPAGMCLAICALALLHGLGRRRAGAKP